MKNKSLILILTLVCQFLGFAQSGNNSETLYPVFVKGKYGYINSKGEMIISPQFDKAGRFHDGLALVTVESKNISDTPGHYDYILGKEGYIDKTGKFVIPPGKFYLAEDFSEGLAGVRINGCKKIYCYGYIDVTGKVVIEPQFQTVGKFHEGTADVRMPNDKWGIIDKKGKFIIPPIYDAAVPFFEGVGIGLSIKNKRKLPGDQKISDFEAAFYDKTGKIIARPQYFVFGSFSEGLVEILTEKGIGFIDKFGKVVIEPKFEKAMFFSEGLCAVRLEKKWGFIDKKGAFIIQPIYDDAYLFSNGLAKVVIKGKTGFIDKTGKFIIEPQEWDISNFEGDLAFVRLTPNISGYIDKTGQFIWQLADR